MKSISLLIICISIGAFLWTGFDIETYQSYHSKSIKQDYSSNEDQTFLDTFIIRDSPQREDWIVDIINEAQQEIKIAIYMFTVPSIMDALLRAHRRGVNIKIILEKNPFNATTINKKAVQFFKKNNIIFHETDSKNFAFMHAKYFIIDEKWFIATANWTRSSFSANREFFIQGNDPKILNNLENIFEGDFGGKSGLSDDDRLLLGPTNAREKIIKLFTLVDKNIKIYMPSITDEEIILEIQKMCKKEKNISILVDENAENIKEGNNISQNGCPNIRVMKNPSLHAKAIIIDEKKGFVGSFNFTKNSLENNRELGVFIDGDSIEYIVNKFRDDWRKSIAF